MTVSTSKPSPVEIGQARNKETIYTATRTTKLADGTYSVEMLQYSDAKGAGGKVIATRDSVNEWTFNDNASTKVKQNESRLNNASKTQMESMRGQFVEKSQEAEEYNRAQGEPNKAPNDNSESNAKPAPPSQTEESVSGTRTSFPNLRYPMNIAKTKQDIIKFDMHEYVPSKVAKIGQANAFGFSRGELGPSIGSVVLPIPSGISDQNKADWGSNSMTALDIAKAEIARRAIFNGLSDGAKAVSDYMEAVKQNSGATATAVGNSLAAAAAGVDGQALLSRTTGQVLNPNMELLFKGPSLRPFSFKFQLSPRDKEEANQVIKILRFFKQGSAPIRSKSNLFLKSPHIFRIKYVRMGEEGELHRGLNTFKTCALQSVGVNYTPTGNYATYSDGVMVSYDLSMSFSEITPIFNDDYGTGDNDQFIGF